MNKNNLTVITLSDTQLIATIKQAVAESIKEFKINEQSIAKVLPTNENGINSIRTVSEILKTKLISRRTLYRYIHEGKLTLHKVGSRSFIDINEFNALFLSANPKRVERLMVGRIKK